MTDANPRRDGDEFPDEFDPYAGQFPDTDLFPPPPVAWSPEELTERRNRVRRTLAPIPATYPEDLFHPGGRPAGRKVKSSRPSPRSGPWKLGYVSAGFLAIIVGGTAGLAMNHLTVGAVPRPVAPAVAASASIDPPAIPAKSNSTTIVKKLVTSARLDVADVTGSPNTLIPMALSAIPTMEGEDLMLRISGLPPSAYLTAGERAGQTAWQVSAGEAKGLKLVVTDAKPRTFDLAVTAFERNTGELAAPMKEIQVAILDPAVKILPASAPPEGTEGHGRSPEETVRPPVSQGADATRMVAKGDFLLANGDIDMARQFYERAYAEGSAMAALGAGKTYDPVVYAQLKVVGLEPDPQQALAWYQRAMNSGNTEAAAAIVALEKTAP